LMAAGAALPAFSWLLQIVCDWLREVRFLP
jgi:hypothetical protein